MVLCISPMSVLFRLPQPLIGYGSRKKRPCAASVARSLCPFLVLKSSIKKTRVEVPTWVLFMYQNSPFTRFLHGMKRRLKIFRFILISLGWGGSHLTNFRKVRDDVYLL